MIEPCTMADLEADADFLPLVAEYAAECATPGLPSPSARWPTYRALQESGVLHVFRAVSDRLVGFIMVLAVPLPHYDGPPVAVSESFFVGLAHRMSGAGVKLLQAAEAKAAELGSPVLLVSAPYAGKLFEVLPRLGYAETSRVFCKSVP